MKKEFDAIIEKGEDGYFVAYVPELPGCVTQAKNLDALMKRLNEAIELYLETNKEFLKGPKSEFVGIQRVEIEA